MRVKDLIRRLELADPDDIVILSGDQEGNYFNPLGTVSALEFNAEPPHYTEIGLRKLTRADIRLGWSEDDVMDGPPCVVLWP